jgi:uncharacterized protein
MAIKEVKIDDCEKVLLIRINKRYHKNISKEELYEATRGIWRINQQRASNVEYAFALFEGIIKEVYKINQWYKAGTLKYSFTDTFSFADSRRWEFEGEVADNNLRSKYIDKSVREYFKPGNQNPIKYVNC